MSASQALDMVKTFTPKEPTRDYRVPLVDSLSIDLNLIARIRTRVNERVGDKTKVSPTEMLIEAAQEIRDSQFADWGGRPTSDEEVERIIEREVKLAKERLPTLPKLSILSDAKPEPKKPRSTR